MVHAKLAMHDVLDVLTVRSRRVSTAILGSNCWLLGIASDCAVLGFTSTKLKIDAILATRTAKAVLVRLSRNAHHASRIVHWSAIRHTASRFVCEATMLIKKIARNALNRA